MSSVSLVVVELLVGGDPATELVREKKKKVWELMDFGEPKQVTAGSAFRRCS